MFFQFAVVLLALSFAVAGNVDSGKSKNKKQSDQTQQTATKVDLNTASDKELDSLPGVGPATVKKIVAGRPYSSVDDLKKAGVSQSQIEKIRGLVTVSSGPTSAAQQASSNGSAGKAKPSPVQPLQSASALPESDNSAAAPPPGSGMVWVNLDTKVYHREGDRWYGKTRHGQYMKEGDAQKAGYRPAKNSK
jgi:hypothetical protein